MKTETAVLSTDKLLKIGEVADRMGVCKATVRKLVAEGQMSATRVSARAVRVYETAVEEYLSARAI